MLHSKGEIMKIKLTGEQQIAIIHKSSLGSWVKLEKWLKRKNDINDLKVVKAVRNIERKHKIRFVYDQFEPMRDKEIRFHDNY